MTYNTGCDAESDFTGDIIRQHVMPESTCTALAVTPALRWTRVLSVAHSHLKDPLGVRNRLSC